MLRRIALITVYFVTTQNDDLGRTRTTRGGPIAGRGRMGPRLSNKDGPGAGHIEALGSKTSHIV